MNIDELKDKGFKIVTNWQEIDKKSIFLLNSDDVKKFSKYNKIAQNKKCKFIICNDKFKNRINQNIESDGKINYLNFTRIILDNVLE